MPVPRQDTYTDTVSSCYPGKRPVAETLLTFLKNNGIEVLGARFPFEIKRLSRLGFQYVGVEMLVRDYNIYPVNYKGRVIYYCNKFTIIGGKGNEVAQHVVSSPKIAGRYVKPVITSSELETTLGFPPRPLILIDMGFFKLHTDEEKNSLKVQIAMSLSKIREYLWDQHLALANAPANLQSWLFDVAGLNRMLISKEKPGEILWSMKLDNVIILRPDAEKELASDELMNADAFVLGGIVDKIPRPGISRILDMQIPWGKPRRLSLKGSIIGVPSRLNRVVEILLRARFDLNGDLERAIIKSMAKYDKINRLFYEFSKNKNTIKRQDICSILDNYRWLEPSIEDIRIALRKAHITPKENSSENCSRG